MSALPPGMTVHVLARDEERLASLVAGRPNTVPHVVDLSSRESASAAGEKLARSTDGSEPVLLVHNAGLWPSKRTTVGGLERAFVVNCVAPLAFQAPLLPKLARILVIGAGLMSKGRFDADRTPIGADFSWMRTYASTKLAFAVAVREIARGQPHLDVAVVHPGVVRTDLGARSGLLGWLVARVKQRWESPEACAERLARLVLRERLASPGEARWFVEENEEPWPAVVDESRLEVLRALAAVGQKISDI